MPHITRSIFKTLVIASLGSNLEMYDFIIYIFFAPIIGKQFFPSKSELASLLLVFGVFAVSFFCRTIGAFIFGYFSDTHGRKNTLVYTITFMVIPMTILTFLPTYQQIGIAAPIILTIMRCLQGFAVGGEFSGSITLMAEYAKPHHRGYVCSWIIAALNLGILLASIVTLVITKVFIEHYNLAWGWRIAFFLGCILAFVIVYIRRHFEESPIFKEFSESNQVTKGLTKKLIHKQSTVTLHLIFATIGAALTVGMIMFFPTYLQKFTLMQAPAIVLSYNTFFLIVLCLFVPMFGALSDKIGRKMVMGAGLLSIAILIYPVARLLSTASHAILMMFACALLALIISPVLGVFGCFLAESFPTNFRATGIGLAYNVPFTFITGTFPLFSLLIVKYTHSINYQYLYIIILALISLFFVATFNDKKNRWLP